MIISKPDYIIFDLFADVYFGVLQRCQNKEEVFVKEEKRISLSDGTNNTTTNIYYQTSDTITFRRCFDRFFQEVKKKLPKSKVIMHRMKLSPEFFDNPSHGKLPYDILNDFNFSFFMLEETIQKYNITKIDVFSNSENPGECRDLCKSKTMHFCNRYYDSFINQFNNICLIDML